MDARKTPLAERRIVISAPALTMFSIRQGVRVVTMAAKGWREASKSLKANDRPAWGFIREMI
jgi:hypothetical protein